MQWRDEWRRKIFSISFLALIVVSVFLFSDYLFSAGSDIVITEICPTGCGAKDHQWIEIYNKRDDAIDLSGWKFVEEDTNHGLTISASSVVQDFSLAGHSYAIITQNDVVFFEDHPDINVLVMDSSWSTLNKSGEHIALRDAQSTVVEEFDYSVIENFSLERIDAWQDVYDENNWKEHVNASSPGAQNYWYIEHSDSENVESVAPIALISATSSVIVGDTVLFDASGSYDSDGFINSYIWQIDGEEKTGMNVEHIFLNSGEQTIQLNVLDDDGMSNTTTTVITILDVETEDNSTTSTTDNTIDTTTSTENIVYDVVINEVMSYPQAGDDEWIELYNASDSMVSIDGWELHDGVGLLATLSGNIVAKGFLYIVLSSSKLNNGGDHVILLSATSTIDEMRYGDWVDDLDNDVTDNVSASPQGVSIARIVDGQDTNNDKNDFALTTQITPSESNSIVEQAVKETNNTSQNNNSSGTGPAIPNQAVSYMARDVVINELVSDPSDNEDEFIELYNNSDKTLLLDSWHVEDGSETKTFLTGAISSHGFFVIEKPKGNLNNSGDIVLLYDPTNKEIDRITYGNWDDGNVSDNSMSASDPFSLARKIDGQDADNDIYDFSLTSTITKGKKNLITIVSDNGDNQEIVNGPSTLIISEVLPNPSGDDSQGEFIELKNIGKETIDLKGWKLGDSSQKKYTITQGRVISQSFIVFKRSMTGIALNNTGGDKVILYNPRGVVVDSVQYPGSSDEDMSYVRKDDNSWVWSSTASPGTKNIVVGKSAAPMVIIDTESEVAVNDWLVFDASDSTDPDGDKLHFSWDFGDGTDDEGAVVEHKFEQEGLYMVSLIVSDGVYESKKDVAITVKFIADFVGGYVGGDDVSRIWISELLANPYGSDTTEFVELYNPSDTDIDMSGIKLDDEEGGSRAYSIPKGTILLAGSYKVFARQDSGIAFNNTSDAVRLLYPDGTIMQEIRYDDVVEGASYIQDDEGLWIWTSVVTPGEKNIVNIPTQVKGTKILKKSAQAVNTLIDTTLARVRDEDVGDKIRLRGVVVVEPGILGTQYFYLTEDMTHVTSSSPRRGVQIYMYNKDFPKLAIGDVVEVVGEISESSGETRIKLKTKDDINIISHDAIPVSEDVEISLIGEQYEGSFLSVQGEITELKGSYMYVDDGSDEIKVYFKRGAGIRKDILQEGDLVRVQGLIHETSGEYQLLPRAQTDIQKTGVAEGVVRMHEESAQEQQADLAEKYLTATAGGLTAIFFGLFVKSHGTKIMHYISIFFVWLRKKLKY